MKFMYEYNLTQADSKTKIMVQKLRLGDSLPCQDTMSQTLNSRTVLMYTIIVDFWTYRLSGVF